MFSGCSMNSAWRSTSKAHCKYMHMLASSMMCKKTSSHVTLLWMWLLYAQNPYGVISALLESALGLYNSCSWSILNMHSRDKGSCFTFLCETVYSLVQAFLAVHWQPPCKNCSHARLRPCCHKSCNIGCLRCAGTAWHPLALPPVGRSVRGSGIHTMDHTFLHDHIVDHCWILEVISWVGYHAQGPGFAQPMCDGQYAGLYIFIGLSWHGEDGEGGL